MFYSGTTNGFYDVGHTDTPADAVEITDEVYMACLAGNTNGKVIVNDGNGKPMLIDNPQPPPLTKGEVKLVRQHAYANPESGSDRMFAEVTRLSLMGGTASVIEAARQAGVDRYEEIRLQFPYPEVNTATS